MDKKKYYHQNISRWKVKMMFKRKVYEELQAWKKEWDGKYACLLEGARRVGKTTIAEEFARNEYDSYILIDFSNTSKEIMDIFQLLKERKFWDDAYLPFVAITLYENKDKIDIDCGCVFNGGQLACLRLDDMKIFYEK